MTYRAGFDVGGTNARVQLFDATLKGVDRRRRRVRGATSPDDIAQSLTQLLVEVCDDNGVAVDAVGIGLAGQLSTDGHTVHNAPNLGWRDVDFVERFADHLRKEQHLKSPPSIRLVNDLNAQLWGEYLGGAVEAVDDVLAVYVGTGIGGAILADGHLVTGADANAGEIGHSKVVIGGRPCGCGESGCVEAYAGGIHLERRVAELVDAADDEALAAVSTESGVDLGAADALADSHDQIGQIWEEATDYLAIIVANAATLLNPAALLIGGGVLDNCETFRAMTLQKTIPLILEVARRNLVVEQASLGDVAGMLGAADLAAMEVTR